MALDVTQQVVQSIEKASRVLVVPHKDFNADAFVSALALTTFLKKLGKDTDLFTSYETPEKFTYLPQAASLEKPARLSGDFIIHINTKERRIKELRYQKEEGAIKIYLTPELEPLSDTDIMHERAGEHYDIVITLGCPDLESAGEVFEHYPYLFFNRPVINIDRKPHNEEFAEINLINVTSSALAEIITELIEDWSPGVMDEEIATILLTGLIAGTNNFRAHSTTPETLSKAASLITQGGDHQAIIQNLYKTKDLATLKLLGRLMSTTDYIEDIRMSWSELTSADLQETGSTAKDLTMILDEFREQFPHPEIMAISLTNGSSKDYVSKTLLYSPKHRIIDLLHKHFGGETRLDKLIIETRGAPPGETKEKIAKLLRNQ